MTWNSKCVIIAVILMNCQIVHMEEEKGPLRLEMYFDADNAEFGNWLRAVVQNELVHFLPYLEFAADVCISMEVNEKTKTLKCAGTPDESCYLNKLHACATSLDSEPMVRFMACTAMTDKGIPSIDECVGNNPAFLDVVKCANNGTGYDECVQMFKDMKGGPGTPTSFLLTNNVSSAFLRTLFDFKHKMCYYMKAFQVPYPEDYCKVGIIHDLKKYAVEKILVNLQNAIA